MTQDMNRLLDSSEASSAINAAWRAIAHSNGWGFCLLAGGIASAIVYPHAPLAAFAAMAGVSLPRQRAIALIGILWLVNQGLGFWMRDYPLTGISFGWGAVMGSGALLAAVLASWRPGFSQRSWAGYLGWGAIAIFGSFAVYQGLIVAVFPVLAAGHGMDAALVARLLGTHLRWVGAIAPVYALLLFLSHRQQQGKTPAI